MYLNLIVYVISLVLSAYFASAETAYTAVSRVRLRTLAEKDDRKAKKAKRALWVCDHYDKTLTTILIGNNIFHATCASVSAVLVLQQFGDAAVALGTVVTTLIVYLFAEMLPKSVAKVKNEELALFYATGLVVMVKLLTPISAVFSAIAKGLSCLFRVKEQKTVTEEELVSLIETIEDEGVLDPEKQALVNSAMEFRDKHAIDVMTPLAEIESIPSTVSTKKLAELVKTTPYSRLPVYEGHKDNIVGILPVNQFLSHFASGRPVPMRKLLMKPFVFDAQIEISELLHRMRLNKLHMVFLVGEGRKKIGLVTMEDLLEELVGEIQDESDAGEVLEMV